MIGGIKVTGMGHPGINTDAYTIPRNEDSRGLMEIEARYIQDIVVFFAKELYDLHVYRDTRNISGIKNELTRQLETQIVRKLYEPRFIKEYLIEILETPIDLVRDAKISNLLDGTNAPITQLYVKFDYIQRSGVETKSVMIAL